MRAKGRVNATAFANAHGLDEEILVAICTALHGLRIFTHQNGTYTLAARHLVHAGSTEGWLLASTGYEDIRTDWFRYFSLDPRGDQTLRFSESSQ